MDVKKLVRFACPAARPPPPPQSTTPPFPFVGFSTRPKYLLRIACQYSPRSVFPSLASSIRMIFDCEFPEGDVKQVFPYTSESGLIYSALRAQVLWLIELLSEEISPKDKSFLLSLVNRDTAGRITKRLLDVYRNDVSFYYVEAVRSFLKDMCRYADVSNKVCELVDSSCTEEDIDSLTHGLMLKDAMDSLILPAMDDLIMAISAMNYGCFHPSAVKDLNDIASYLGKKRAQISDCKIGGDFYAAAQGSGSPKSLLAERFVGSLGLSVKPYTYQRLAYAQPLISGISIFNTFLIDFVALVFELIKLNGQMKIDGDFARCEYFLSRANRDLFHLDKYSGTPPRKEKATLPLASSTPTFFSSLIQDLVRSLVGYQIAKEEIKKA